MRKNMWFGGIQIDRPGMLPGEQLCDQSGLLRSYHGKKYLLPLGARISSRILTTFQTFIPPSNPVGLPVSTAIRDLSHFLSGEINSYKQVPTWLQITGHHNLSTRQLKERLSLPDLIFSWLMVSNNREVTEAERWSSGVQEFLERYELDQCRKTDTVDCIQWFYPSEEGPDEMLECPECSWLGEGAFHPLTDRTSSTGPDPMMELSLIETPGVTSIPDLAAFLEIPPEKCIKSLLFQSDQGLLVQVLVRGDLSVSVPKVEKVLGIQGLRPAEESTLLRAGAAAGYAGPVMGGEFSTDRVLTDLSIQEGVNYAAGANRSGYHVTGVRMGRDFSPGFHEDAASAQAGDRCSQCGSLLVNVKGHVVAEWVSRRDVFSLTDSEGLRIPVGFGLGSIHAYSLMLILSESGFESGRMKWPYGLEPFLVYLISIQAEDETESLYLELQKEGIPVFFDDRDVRPGVKFNDADLFGCPYRVTVSPRSLEQGGVELFTLSDGKKEIMTKADLKQQLLISNWVCTYVK